MLLELLQTGGVHTVADLAAHLDVDERTARRYVGHLRDLDVPVDSLRGRYGGYRLARHYRLPPLMLSDEEALAVVWALSASEVARPGPTSLLAVRSALAKVRRVLPVALARRVGAVLDHVTFAVEGSGASSERTDDSGNLVGQVGTRVLLTLAEAARDRHLSTFSYTSRQGGTTQRHVQPHGLVALGGRLYLSGYDVDRQALRTFRLDRMKEVHQLDETFTVPDDVDPLQQVRGPLAEVPWRHDVSVRILGETAHVRSHIPETLASITALRGVDEGWLRVSLRAERLEWVAGALAVLDRPFVIEEPRALRDVVAALGHRLVAHADAATDEGAAAQIWAEDSRGDQPVG